MAYSFKKITTPALLALAALAVGPLAGGCVAQVDVEPGETAEELAGLPCSDRSATLHSCKMEDGVSEGTHSCASDENGLWTWTDCTASSSWSTPLVLSFDRAPVAFAASAGSFDLTGTMSVTTDWPTAKTPWLALDRDGDGQINDGGELFGSATVLTGGARAVNGFVALRELDSNNDGRITEADASWSKLLVWSDGDGDRLSTSRELEAASSRKLLSIELGYTTAGARCDARSNCEIERASFRYVDDTGVERTGDVIDVHLKFQ